MIMLVLRRKICLDGAFHGPNLASNLNSHWYLFDGLPEEESEKCWDEPALLELKQCKQYIQRFYDSIDTGNRDEAEAFANDNCRPDEEREPMEIIWH